MLFPSDREVQFPEEEGETFGLKFRIVWCYGAAEVSRKL